MPALYASLTVMTVIKEANPIGSFQPITLVAYDAEIEDVFDCRDDTALQAEKMDAVALADASWRDRMKATGEAPTQAFARRLVAQGFRALLVRSFAAAATADDLNLVLWQWSDAAPSRLILVDDENRPSQ